MQGRWSRDRRDPLDTQASRDRVVFRSLPCDARGATVAMVLATLLAPEAGPAP